MRLNLLLASVAAVAMAAPLTTAAQTPQQNQPVEVEIDQGVLRPLQIAVVPFAGNDPAQTDVAGIYAWVMLQAFELTDDKRFLDEARAAVRLSETPGEIATRPPTLGEHTEEVLAALGYDVGEIARLRETGVV